MTMRHALLRTGQYLALSGLFFVLFIAGHLIPAPPMPNPVPPDQAWAILPALALVSLVDTAMIMLVILRSTWHGWRLIGATALSFYGVTTFMSQIETAWFGPALNVPAAMLPSLFLSIVPLVLLFTPTAAWVLGKARPWNAAGDSGMDRLHLSAQAWGWRLAVIAVAYVVFYFGFGYVVAWQNPALRELYGNGANPEVFNFARLIPFQLLRGVLWALFALPLIVMDRGPARQTALVVGLWLALPMNIVHAIPNGFMPDPSIRLSHFVETAASNFLFGVLLTLLILWRPRRAAQPVPERPAA